MSKAYNGNIRKALGLALQLSDLAEQGHKECNDETCGHLYARIRESADAILTMAEREMQGHKAINKWD